MTAGQAGRGKMEKTVQELKTIIRDLIIEVGELKERITRLEKDVIDPVLEQESLPEGEGDIFDLDLQAESYENLGRIYAGGYHVCPVAFGRHRNEECLFCLSFMEKE
jgi:regulator of replication initiation timing